VRVSSPCSKRREGALLSRLLVSEMCSMRARADSPTALTDADGFRFCFFLRPNSNDRHVVLLKDRHYVPRPLPGQEGSVEPEANTAAEDAPPSPPVTRASEGRGRKRGRDESEQAMSAEPEGAYMADLAHQNMR
jgi:hypothetical protein